MEDTQVKGIREPLAVYEVLGVGALRTRLQVAARRGLARFVGRRAELEQLRLALQQATAGHGQFVAMVGEAGVGKSRLLHEFKERSQRGCLVLVDTVKQDVRFTDNHLGRSAEVIVAVSCSWLSLLLRDCRSMIDAGEQSVCRWRCGVDSFRH
jgi:hypothetical protein